MELDTGAEVSVIPESVYKSMFGNKQLVKSSFQLKTYLGDSIPVAGEIEVEVKYQSQIAQAVRFVVVATNGPALIGRDLLKKIRLDWSQINRVSDTLTLSSVNSAPPHMMCSTYLISTYLTTYLWFGSPGSREASRDACKGVASGCDPPVPWGGEMWRAQDNGFTKQN